MSEGARKDCRTQGKYSERSQYEDKRCQKRQDRKLKGSPTEKEPQEKIFQKRRSDGGKVSNTSLISESESLVRYEKNSVHAFSQLKDMKKPVEIRNPGKHILSNTENGESVILYDPYFLKKEEAYDLERILQNTTEWNEKKIVIHGAEVPQPRLVAWYGPFPYSYSGTTLDAAEMPGTVLGIKEKVEDYLNKNGINVTLNSVLLNLYRDNKDSVAWHSDDELSMGVCPTIASVSLGVTRKFEMRSKVTKTRDGDSPGEYFINLANGSLLIMDGCMQKDWQHRVPKEYHDRGSRINLTFRTVYKSEDLPPSPGTYSPNPSRNDVPKKRNSSQTDLGVSYDDENFPPLNNGASPSSPDLGKESMGMKSQLHKGRNNGTWVKGRESKDISDRLKTEDKIGESAWDAEPSSRDPIVEPLHHQRSTILNNLNEDKKNVKMDMQSKNLCISDSNFSGSNANVRKYETKGSYNGPAVNENRIWTPNVEAKEFVPNFVAYDTFDLENLLNYNVDLMDSDKLRKYAFSLKNRVSEKMEELSDCAEELEMLCELTDGDQTEKNQRIISKRMKLLVTRALRQDFQKPRPKMNPRNQNNFSGRKHQSSSKERHYRH